MKRNFKKLLLNNFTQVDTRGWSMCYDGLNVFLIDKEENVYYTDNNKIFRFTDLETFVSINTYPDKLYALLDKEIYSWKEELDKRGNVYEN